MAQSALPEDQRRSGSPAEAPPEPTAEPDRSQPLEASGSRGDWSSTKSTQHPFVFQRRHQLFLLDGGAGDWVLAELRFDLATCRYVEVRRASYHWPREALSSLLSRMLTGDRDDEDVLDQATASFAHWLSGQFQTHH